MIPSRPQALYAPKYDVSVGRLPSYVCCQVSFEDKSGQQVKFMLNSNDGLDYFVGNNLKLRDITSVKEKDGKLEAEGVEVPVKYVQVDEKEELCQRADFGRETTFSGPSVWVEEEVVFACQVHSTKKTEPENAVLRETLCENLREKLRGGVAVVSRADSDTESAEKARRAWEAGAIAVIVVNNEDTDVSIIGDPDNEAKDIDIPVISVSASVGAELVIAVKTVGTYYKMEESTPKPPISEVFSPEQSLSPLTFVTRSSCCYNILDLWPTSRALQI